jgi:4-hydroxy-tetrahydrodipicolinate synthase
MIRPHLNRFRALARAPSIRAKPALRLSGLITALATPFDREGALDLAAFRRLLVHQVDAGVQALVVAGSTGEAAMLDDAEFDALLRTAVETVGGRVPLLAGTGASGTARTIALTRRAAAAGVDAALVVTPPYVRPTQAGLLAHYRAVAEQGGLPLVLYNVTARTCADLLPETVAELVGHERIIAIKEASADRERMRALIALKGPDFAVFSGDDASAGQAIGAGADGLVSVGSNVAPASYRRLCDMARQAAWAQAEAWDQQLAPLHAFCGVQPNPIPVKALLQAMGCGQGLRLPLLPLSGQYRGELDRMLALIAQLEAHCGHSPLAA